jgi:hypothetical protein
MPNKILRRGIMNRSQVIALLDDGKATNGGANDFMITVPLSEVRSVLTVLSHLKAHGTISNYDRRNAPDNDTIDVFGYGA